MEGLSKTILKLIVVNLTLVVVALVCCLTAVVLLENRLPEYQVCQVTNAEGRSLCMTTDDPGEVWEAERKGILR